jgi:hypothetical protein
VSPKAALPSLLAALALLATAPADAQRIVTSPRPDSVDVTLYRDDQRSWGAPFNLSWLGGYALISETRRITLPAGESELRFEGVAAGMVPQSAIVSGLPEGIVERNRDAYLLSPATLIDRSLGRRVRIRRTSLATGRVRRSEAVIRTGADGAVVLETEEGFEALRCTGLPETLVYDGVPAGLSAKPTLSIRARSSQAVTATVTLSYIATGFDWQANYIATLSEDGATADLFAWLTLASNDETSFPNADTQAVAGHVNRDRVEAQEVEAGAIDLRCWPHSTTSDIPLEEFLQSPPPPPLPPPMLEEAISVSGHRAESAMMMSASPLSVVTAQQEDLGAVKLYRIPEPVTIAANSQKQVTLLQRQGVRVELVHRVRFYSWSVNGQVQQVPRMLIARNRRSEGLGLPLPAGPIILFAEGAGRPILIGEGMIADRAVDEDVEVHLGLATGVTARMQVVGDTPANREIEVVVTNDGAQPVRFEAEFEGFESRAVGPQFERRDGRPLWRAVVPANGTSTLRFPVRQDD